MLSEISSLHFNVLCSLCLSNSKVPHGPCPLTQETFLETLFLAVWTLYTLTTLNYFKKKKKLYDFHNLLLILMGC